MSIAFRIDKINLTTIGGEVEYEFTSALTVLAGSVGVGKSTLFELIKHGLGGDALLADVVETSVTEVTLNITIGNRKLSLSRATLKKNADRVRVFDLQDQLQLEDHFIKKADPELSSLLLTAMDLPDDMHAAAQERSTKKGARITFNDVLKYMYVSQADINKHIANSGDSYYQPKRKAVFELLLGLTNPAILDLQSRIAVSRGQAVQAEHDYSVVSQFLADTKTQSRTDAVRAMLDATRQKDEAQKLLTSIRNSVSPAIDNRTQTLRDLLGEAERNLGEAQSTLSLLQQQRADFKREQGLVKQDIDRISRMQSAGERLADIEFAVCPRCMQSLQKRQVPEHACRLCLQDDPVSHSKSSISATYEQTHLQEQAEELGEQINQTDEEIAATKDAINSRSELIEELSRLIEERTRERITPQLQAYADATAQDAKATTLQHEIEKTLQQWDRADDLKLAAETYNTQLQTLESELREAEEALKSRRDEIFDELDEEFAEVVSAIRIPGVNVATINRRSYLPILNGKDFRRFSPEGGGVRTATQIAYWITLMNVTLRRRDTHFPAFLLIDSPRTSLNNDDDLSAELYRKLVTMADAAEGRVQVIIGDNELPASYRQDYNQISFDYHNPTISTIKHPGREAVKTLDSSDE